MTASAATTNSAYRSCVLGFRVAALQRPAAERPPAEADAAVLLGSLTQTDPRPRATVSECFHALFVAQSAFPGLEVRSTDT